MIGGARAKAGKKNSMATRAGKKKVQRLAAEEKKNSTRLLCPGPPRSLVVRPLIEGVLDLQGNLFPSVCLRCGQYHGKTIVIIKREIRLMGLFDLFHVVSVSVINIFFFLIYGKKESLIVATNRFQDFMQHSI